MKFTQTIEIPDFPTEVMQAVEKFNASVSITYLVDEGCAEMYVELECESDDTAAFEAALKACAEYDAETMGVFVKSQPYFSVMDPTVTKYFEKFSAAMEKTYPNCDISSSEYE